jgi:hypothetical protein
MISLENSRSVKIEDERPCVSKGGETGEANHKELR